LTGICLHSACSCHVKSRSGNARGRTAHFLHELYAFAVAPLPLEIYDRVRSYPPRSGGPPSNEVSSYTRRLERLARGVAGAWRRSSVWVHGYLSEVHGWPRELSVS
jgi:hypothetical protein